MPRWPQISARERFLKKVDTSAGPDGCHVWTGARSVHGYGQFGVTNPRRNVYAHRWALEESLGRPLGSGEWALHRCDNPPCVNPLHLYVGDQTRNMRDCVERGRARLEGLALGRTPGKTLGKYRTGTELCGTYPGYGRHLRHGEPPCGACSAATNEYRRNRLAARS